MVDDYMVFSLGGGNGEGSGVHQNEVINMAAECRKTEADNVS